MLDSLDLEDDAHSQMLGHADLSHRDGVAGGAQGADVAGTAVEPWISSGIGSDADVLSFAKTR
ncbi:MAG: hypothetical protein MI976_23010 [Pseudomonadales bacterium]|nr:hypothetical protein [Pseudomonadales bacterium]